MTAIAPYRAVITLDRNRRRGEPSNAFSRTGDAVWARTVTAQRRRREAARVRQRLAAIDRLVNVIEERHLMGDRHFDAGLRRRLHSLEDEVGLPVPRAALRARNTVRLHAALLDWQETVLDELRPERLSFPDVHDGDWKNPIPQGW
jgi:hypothetical protein